MKYTSGVTKFSPKCQKKINEQINAELRAGYVYQALYAYFARHDVALPSVAAFFKKSYLEEHEHANKFVDYMNQRGGIVEFSDINVLELKSISLLSAFEKALELEKAVHHKLILLHHCAAEENEPHLIDFIESEFLTEQVRAEDELVRLITNIKRVGPGLGEFIFDHELKKE